jgi:hypothetical protein
MSPQHSPRYDAAFKRRAVEEVLVHHQSVGHVARQLCCSPQSVANWVKQYQNHVDPNHSPNRSPNHSPNRSSNHSTQPSPSSFSKSHSSSSHPVGQGSSSHSVGQGGSSFQHERRSLCHSGQALSHFSAKSSSLPSVESPSSFLPAEVVDSEMSPLISQDPSLLPHRETMIGIVARNGLTLRFPVVVLPALSETALDVLADLVRRLESSSC